MRCQELREIMDSYLSDELLVETNHEVLRHLEDCAVCRGELAARRNLRTRLLSAVKNAPDSQISQTFETKLRTKLRSQVLRPPFWERLRRGAFGNPMVWATAAAGLLIGIFFGAFWLINSNKPVQVAVNSNRERIQPQNFPDSESTETRAVRAAWMEMSRQAAGDHENCAIKFNLAQAPITLAEAAEKYGRFNRDLEKAVLKPLREAFGDKIKLVEAHSCVFEKRRFAHVVLKQKNKTISVLVTDSDLKTENDETIICESSDKMRVACFRTTHHAIFVVSDLPETENLMIARMISPAVRRHIENTERTA
ncbi:MAG: hypothetical protein ABI954_03090 [Pyrinomonadaceae bacterium]